MKKKTLYSTIVITLHCLPIYIHCKWQKMPDNTKKTGIQIKSPYNLTANKNGNLFLLADIVKDESFYERWGKEGFFSSVIGGTIGLTERKHDSVILWRNKETDYRNQEINQWEQIRKEVPWGWKKKEPHILQPPVKPIYIHALSNNQHVALSQNNIFLWDGTKWTQHNVSLKNKGFLIAITGNSLENVWITVMKRDNTYLNFQFSPNKFGTIQNQNTYRSFSIGHDDSIWALSADGLMLYELDYYYDTNENNGNDKGELSVEQSRPLNITLERIYVHDEKNIYGLTKTNELYMLTENKKSFAPLDTFKNIASIVTKPNNAAILAITGSGNLYQWIETQKEREIREITFLERDLQQVPKFKPIIERPPLITQPVQTGYFIIPEEKPPVSDFKKEEEQAKDIQKKIKKSIQQMKETTQARQARTAYQNVLKELKQTTPKIQPLKQKQSIISPSTQKIKPSFSAPAAPSVPSVPPTQNTLAIWIIWLKNIINTHFFGKLF